MKKFDLLHFMAYIYFGLVASKVTNSLSSNSKLDSYEGDKLPSDYSCSFTCAEILAKGYCNYGIGGCSSYATGPFTDYCRESCFKCNQNSDCHHRYQKNGIIVGNNGICKYGICHQKNEEESSMQFVEYEDVDDMSDSETHVDGGIFQQSPSNNAETISSRSCSPNIRLCSKVNGISVCKKGKLWIRRNFNEDAETWRVISPFVTSNGRKNCCFQVFEYPKYSKQGKSKIIRPGDKEKIDWNIRSMKVSKKTCN